MIEKPENAWIKDLNDQKHLLNVQILWMMFVRILTITNQTEKEKI